MRCWGLRVFLLGKFDSVWYERFLRSYPQCVDRANTRPLATMRVIIAPCSSPVRPFAPRARLVGRSRRPSGVAASFSFEGRVTSETSEARSKHAGAGGHAGTYPPIVRFTERGIPSRYPGPRLPPLRVGCCRTTLLPRLRRASKRTFALVGDRPAILGSAGHHRARDGPRRVRTRRVSASCWSFCSSKKTSPTL